MKAIVIIILFALSMAAMRSCKAHQVSTPREDSISIIMMKQLRERTTLDSTRIFDSVERASKLKFN